MLLSVGVGNASEEFNRSGVIPNDIFRGRKVSSSPGFGRTEVGPVGWAGGGIRLGLHLRLRSSASGHPLNQF